MKEKFKEWDSKQDWKKYSSWVCNVFLLYVFGSLFYYLLELSGVVPFPVK